MNTPPIEPLFAGPVAPGPNSVPFRVFCFVRGMLLGTSIRFRHFEVFGIRDGLDERDEIERVNAFMRDAGTPFQFGYEDEEARQARAANPVCVFHFPIVVGPSDDAVRGMCESQANGTLLALALTREASGSVFETVVINNVTNQASRYSRRNSYVGNLMTGMISGENPDTLRRLTSKIARSSFDRFLVQLFKEAQAEKSSEFKYVRLWGILEVLVDERNYHEARPLIDHAGNPIAGAEGPLSLKSAEAKAFTLLRDAGVGDPQQLWRNVNVWSAFRNATAHYGSMQNVSSLGKALLRQTGASALAEIRQRGYDGYVLEMLRLTKELLIKKLEGAAPWSSA